MKRIIFATLALAALCLTGCKTAKETAHVTQPVTAQDGKPEPVQRQYYSATFDCCIDGLTVNGLLRMCEDSVLWVSVSKFIELGRARLTADSVSVYAKILNRYFDGTYQQVEQATRYHTDFSTFQKRFLDAFEKGEKHIIIPIESKQWKGNVAIDLKKVTKEQRLSFPFAIPNNATKWDR